MAAQKRTLRSNGISGPRNPSVTGGAKAGRTVTSAARTKKRRADLREKDTFRRILLAIDGTAEATHLEALRLSEIRHRCLFEGAKDGILIVDPETRQVTEANPFMTELLGYARAEVLGKELWEIGVFQSQSACEAMFRELHEKAVFRDDNFSARTKMGGRRALEMVSNLYTEAGRKVIQCHLRDITERKRAEEKLRESETRLAAELADTGALQKISGEMIQEENVDALYEKILDASVAVMHSDMGSMQMFYPERGDLRLLAFQGFSSEASAFWEWVRPDSGSTCGVALRMGQRFATTDIEKCDLIVGTPDFDVYRETGIRAVQSTPLVSRSGRVVGMISTHWRHAHEPSEHALRLLDILARQAADLIERKRAQEELGRAKRQLDEQAAHLEQLVCERTAELAATNKQLEALVYSMAHDLRAPLRAMSGFSAMLVEQAGAALGESGQQFAHRISRAAQFMDALLMDLLAFSRISRERLVLSPVNLDSVVQSVLERLAGDVEEKKARVEAAPPPWPTVLADATVLGQVVFNLVENALKFVPSDQPPLARLRAEDRGEVVRMWVEDNGIGISPEAQRQVFEIFTRLHGEKFPGTGIGLAIVQKGVERMGGRVGLESTPGQGSRFWFELRKA